MVLTGTITVIAIADVLMATSLIITYIILMSDHLPQLQIVQGSKKKHVIVYLYVSLCTIIQLFFAFNFYKALTEPREDHEDVHKLISTSKRWLIASYILLINWIIKAGIYSQQCNDCSISIALSVYLIEIVFRICAICIVNPYIGQLEKRMELRLRQLKLEVLSHCGKHLSREDLTYAVV